MGYPTGHEGSLETKTPSFDSRIFHIELPKKEKKNHCDSSVHVPVPPTALRHKRK